MRIPIQINENSAEPLYHQIETQRSLIISGQIEEGTLLPSIREFAGNLNCSVITVRRVYQDLENEGGANEARYGNLCGRRRGSGP